MAQLNDNVAWANIILHLTNHSHNNLPWQFEGQKLIN